MFRLIASLTLFGAAPAFASGLEVELGGGGGATWQTFAPAITGRLGVDWVDHITTSVRLLTLTGMHGQLTGTSQDVTSGYQAWAALAELKVHTSGTFQLSAGAGLGVGQPSVAEPWSAAPPHSNSALVPYTQGSLGGRLKVLDSVWLGSDLTLVAWNITLANSPFAGQAPGGPDYGVLLTFSIGGTIPLT
jgi:hypothetical protein